jgi:hypothetical protein
MQAVQMAANVLYLGPNAPAFVSCSYRPGSNPAPRFRHKTEQVTAIAIERPCQNPVKSLMAPVDLRTAAPQETTMRKVILTLVGAALLAVSTCQVAFSKERYHVRNAQHYYTQRFRNTKANAAPLCAPDAGSAYSGLAGAWQTMTGFN